MQARLFLAVALLSLIGSVKLQQFGDSPGNLPNQAGLGGLLNGLLGGLGQQQAQMGGQMPQIPQFGNNMMNGGGQMGQGGLEQLLRNLPQQGIQIIQRLLNGLNGNAQQGFPGQFGHMGGNPMGPMNQAPNGGNGLSMPNPFANAYGQRGNMPQGLLGSLTSGLNLNGLTGQLTNALSGTGLPLNGLTQGLQRTLSNVNL